MTTKIKLKKSDFEVSPWDSADYLKSPAEIEAYLESAFTTNDHQHIARALGTAIKAQGILKTAKKAGLDRSGLYHSFSRDGGDPRLSTITKVMATFGYRLTFCH